MSLFKRFKRRRTADKATDIFNKRRKDTTFLGRDVSIIGDLHCAGNIRLAGRVKGDIRTPGLLFIDLGAHVRGNIVCASSIIQGLVEGHLDVSGKIELGRSSSVKGDIIAGAIAIERKASISGNAVSRFSLFHLFTERRKAYSE